MAYVPVPKDLTTVKTKVMFNLTLTKGCMKPERRIRMPVYKNEDNGTWYVLTRYLDWKGERKQKCKRGFETKREAQEWERVFQQQSAADMDMNFAAFVELYIKDKGTRY